MLFGLEPHINLIDVWKKDFKDSRGNIYKINIFWWKKDLLLLSNREQYLCGTAAISNAPYTADYSLI